MASACATQPPAIGLNPLDDIPHLHALLFLLVPSEAKPLRGVLPAVITPRDHDHSSVDTAAGLNLLQFLESKGVDGHTIFGSTGEFLHFDQDDRIRYAAAVAKHCKVPILVNASHSTLDGSVRLAREAMDSGAAGVMIMAPYYYRYTQPSIRAYCLEFAARVKAPVFLYNIPIFTNEIEIPTGLDLLATGAFAGIKDSTGRWENFEAFVQTGLPVFTGSDLIYSRAARAGAAGTISGLASVVPELMVAVDRAVRSGADTTALDTRIGEFIERAMSFPFPIAFKEAAAVRGLKTGPAASPLGPEECHRMDHFRGWFKEWIRGIEASIRA